MKLPLVIPQGNLSSHLRALQEDVRRLRPVHGTGVRTAATTAGVMRSAKRSARIVRSSASSEPRWA